MSRATNKCDASPRGSNLAYKALKPLAEARKDYVIVVVKRLYCHRKFGLLSKPRL